MKKPFYKILISLILLIALPALLVIFYEYTNLNQSEELITKAYKNQLESMVSSINTYVQDIATNWASRVESDIQFNSPTEKVSMERLKVENKSITGIYALNMGTGKPRNKLVNELDRKADIEKYYKQEQENINQLLAYYKNGYRKINAVNINQQQSIFYFIASDKNQQFYACFIILDNIVFFNNQLRPRLQAIAQENFTITLTNKINQQIMLSNKQESESAKNYDFSGSMWLFPETQINIRLKNDSITNLVNERLREGLILLGLVLIIIALGIWFLYTNIRNQLRLTQIKSEFISNVSHEIRTPLALISMYIETLEMGRVKSIGKTKEYYQIIGKEAVRLSGIVDKILNFSKLESEKRILKFSSCCLNAITQKVLDTYEFHLTKQNFQCHFMPQENLPEIICDGESVADALINLIENAVKYSTHKKQIEIKTGYSKNFIYVEVTDFGMGISKKHQQLIFDKFYRVSNENLANKVKGTGLGLAIVQETMKRHKGKISLSSKLNEGSTFRLLFPINKHKKPQES
jgi:two-component system phosphate regulon sensor histidine kinase PhoR